MPFSDATCGITQRAEKRGHGHSVRLDERGAVSPEDALFEAGTPVVSAGEEAVAGGRADGGTGVGILKDHSIGGERVEMDGVDFGVGIKAGEIAVAHVIGQDIHEVGKRMCHGMFYGGEMGYISYTGGRSEGVGGSAGFCGRLAGAR